MKIKKLNEWCDDLHYSKSYLNIREDLYSGIPFLYNIKSGIVNILFGNKGETHGQIRSYLKIPIRSIDKIWKEGRYWDFSNLDKDYEINGIVSFWDYPDKEDWKPFVNKLEILKGLEIWNNNWMVEVDDRIYGDDILKQDDNVYTYRDEEGIYFNVGLLPVEKYRGNKEVPEELKQIHLQKIKDKMKIKRPDTFGSKADKRPLIWKQALLKSESKIFESPDALKLDDNYTIRHFDKGSKPFAFHPDTDELWIGKPGQGHTMCPFLKGKDKVDYFDLVDKGRLWFESEELKIKNINTISFWIIPDVFRLRNIVSRIEKKLGQSLRGWKIDLDPPTKITGKTKDLYQYMTGEKPKHIGSARDKRSLAYKRYLYTENICNFGEYLDKKEVLNENPDYIDELGVKFDSEGTYPFLYIDYSDDLFIAEEGFIHFDVYNIMANDSDYLDDFYFDYYGKTKEEVYEEQDGLYDEDFFIEFMEREIFPYSGRIFTKEKVITFWYYPSRNDFMKIVKELEEQLKIEIWNDPEYKIEIIDEDGNEVLINVKEYEKSQDVDKEIYMWHLMKAGDKRRKKRFKPETFGSKADKRPLKFKQALLRSENVSNFIEYLDKKEVLNEAPDYIKKSLINKEEVHWMTEGTYPFIYIDKNKDLIIGEHKQNHFKVMFIMAKETDYLDEFYKDYYGISKETIIKEGEIDDLYDEDFFIELMDKETFPYSGRIFTKEKVISFWHYPSRNDFIKIVKELEKHLNVEIWNDSEYKLEIINEKGEEELINVKEYKKSKNFDKEIFLWHLMKVDDPRRKYREKPETFGSKADKRPLKFKQALLKSENKNNNDVV